MVFWICLLSLSIMFSRFIHSCNIYQYSVVKIANSLLLYGYTTFHLSTIQLTDIGVLLLLAIMNNSAMNICVWVFIRAYIFLSLVSIHKIELLCHMTFNELSKCFPKQPYHFTFPQPCIRISVSSYPHQHLLFLSLGL